MDEATLLGVIVLPMMFWSQNTSMEALLTSETPYNPMKALQTSKTPHNVRRSFTNIQKTSQSPKIPHYFCQSFFDL